MNEKELEKKKQIQRFCWHCGKQFRANYKHEYKHTDGHIYFVHKQCKEELTGETNLTFD